MKRKANASSKSKEVQPNMQGDTQLHHICFCPNAPAKRQMSAIFNTFDHCCPRRFSLSKTMFEYQQYSVLKMAV
jgi:hypothetical protein